MTEQEEKRESTNPALRNVLRRYPLLQAFLVALLPAAGAALAGVGAADDAKDRGDLAENKARSGYNVTAADVEALKAHVGRLEARHDAELGALRRAFRLLSAGKKAPPVVVAPPAPALPAAGPPPPLPSFDKAYEQQQQQQQQQKEGTP